MKAKDRENQNSQATPAEVPLVRQRSLPVDLGSKSKKELHDIYYNPFGPENPYPQRDINGMNTHSSDRYDYYSDKELKEMAAGK